MNQILITGANRGIGYEFARQYLIRGCRVFAACRQPTEKLLSLQQEYGDQITLVEMDVTHSAQIQTAYEIICQHTDKLDLLINNAGILRKSERFTEIQPDALLESFAVNTIAPVSVIQRFVPLLEKGQNPKIVNITMPTLPIEKLSSTSNHMYLASRYALNALTKMIALELAPKGIITVALWPGYIKTDMNHMAEEASPAEEMIPKDIEVIESLTMAQNGRCFLPDGRVYSW